MRRLIADSLVLARRNLAHVRQIPEKLIDVTLQPIMFVIMFAYVFGGVIAIPDGSYREYLLGGVLVQSLTFGIMGPATSIATDLREGVVDRFRTLPMARAGVPRRTRAWPSWARRRSPSPCCRSPGWSSAGESTRTCLHALAGYGLILLFAFSMLWCGTLLGISVRSPDAAQGMVFMVVFPMTFVASTFVPIAGFSPVLRVFASWNPISSMAAAVRWLFGNPTGTPTDAAWPLRHPVVSAVGWCLVILAVCMPLAIRRFRARTAG